MFTQACHPCAKRKVRCDRKQPCSNCKRRRHDTCTYTELGAYEEIKRLESLVRELGGDPKQPDTASAVTPRTKSDAIQKVSVRDIQPNSQRRSAKIVRDNGDPIYIESTALSGWHDPKPLGQLRRPEWYLRMEPGSSSALGRVLTNDLLSDLWTKHPPAQEAETLWSAFSRNVAPVIKCSFSCELERFRLLPITPELSFPEQSFIFMVYLLGAISTPAEICVTQFHRSWEELVFSYLPLCEQALVRSDFIGSTDMVVMQALTMYLVAGMPLFSTNSLWSLQGLVLRNAERIGLHRDGTHLDLSPFETERRRRLWWQLQYLDIGLGVWSGTAAMTLTADWDTKLPLNIEDEDLGPNDREFPKERTGLTSMSEVLSKYIILYEQRKFRNIDGSRMSLGWVTDRNLPFADKKGRIDLIEAALNTGFIQYCDPIKSRDLLIQLTSRTIICTLRRLLLHPLAYAGEEDPRDKLLDTSIQLIEYEVVGRTNPKLQFAQWRNKIFFPWGAFIHIISEATQQRDKAKASSMWRLIFDVYSSINSITELAADPRNLHAAEILVPAWRARVDQLGELQSQLPEVADLVAHLEAELAKVREQKEGIFHYQKPKPLQRRGTSLTSTMDMSDMGNLDAVLLFDDIDWSFWEDMDMANL